MTDSYPFQPFTLTLLDQTEMGFFMSYVVSFALPNAYTGLEPLKSAIWQLFKHLPFLAGEVVELPASGGLQLRPLEGAREIPLIQVREHPALSIQLPQDMKDYRLSPLPPVLSSVYKQPVIRFQVNILSDGIILGMSMNHCVLDGSGVGVIFEHLAILCRSNLADSSYWATALAEELKFRRALGSLPSPLKPHVHTDEYSTARYITQMEHGDKQNNLSPLSTCRFMFSAEKLMLLRDECQGAGSPFSRNDVLTALLGIGIARARCKENISVVMSVDLRKRWPERVPKTYLGNMVTTINVRSEFSGKSCHRGKEDDKCLDQVAQFATQIRQQVNRIDHNHIRSLIDFLRCQRDHGAVEIRPAEFGMSSARGLSVYHLDFGPQLGGITDFVMDFGLIDGVGFILPARKTDSSRNELGQVGWEVQLTLNERDMERFKRDVLIASLLE